MNVLFLKQSLESDQIKSGKIKGIAYSGAVIPSHGFIKNLVIDMSTLKVAKAKIPLLRDHDQSQIAGSATAAIEEAVTFEGQVSSKTSSGIEITDLADEGFPWQVSMGIFGGDLQEFENKEYNGQQIPYGVALINGTIREISVVGLGADGETSAEVFNVKPKGEVKMNFQITKEEWTKLACGCGGTPESKPEDISAKFSEKDIKIAELEKEIADAKAEIDAKQAELDKLNGDSTTAARANELRLAVKEKNLELSEEMILESAQTPEATSLLKKFIGESKKLISSDMTKTVEVGDGQSLKVDAKDLNDRANLLAKELNIPFLEALNKLEVK